jgi:hypothetical protein
VTSNGYDSRIAVIQPNTMCRHFLLLLTLAGCDVYSGGGGGYGYGRGPGYYDYGGISPGYAPYYQHNRQDRRWQDQGVDGWPDPRLAGARRLTVCGDVGLIEVRCVRGCLKSMA